MIQSQPPRTITLPAGLLRRKTLHYASVRRELLWSQFGDPTGREVGEGLCGSRCTACVACGPVTAVPREREAHGHANNS